MRLSNGDSNWYSGSYCATRYSDCLDGDIVKPEELDHDSHALSAARQDEEHFYHDERYFFRDIDLHHDLGSECSTRSGASIVCTCYCVVRIRSRLSNCERGDNSYWFIAVGLSTTSPSTIYHEHSNNM